MKNLHLSVVPLLFIVIFSSQVDTIASEPRAQVLEFRCGTTPEQNITEFVPNFTGIMAEISDAMRTNGSALVQVGTGPNANIGLGQCYGDLTLMDCVLCFAEARGLLPGCFPNNSARIYLDGCFIRVENYTFYQEIIGPDDKPLCGNATRNNTRFQESARRALLDAVREAPLNAGFARPKVLVPGSMNDSAYVLANCWRTVNASSCRACLDNAAASAMKCLPSSEGRVLNTGCFLRYSDKDFLNAVQHSGGSKLSKGAIVAIVLSSVGVAVIGAFIGLHYLKNRILQKKRRGSNEDDAVMVKALKKSRLNFDYSTLQKATDNFSVGNKLGHGGFGVVYKGVLGDGREIAVKRLYVNNKHRAGEFFNEITLISRVQHTNLVRLLGCSILGSESLLVYEFLPNLSLDGFLFDPVKGKTLNWQKRLDIIIGAAEGLAYLHENPNVRIIHRDIKASNILLDSKLRPKIADFGLARSFQEDKSHISTVIAGTLGYMAPEYLAHGQLTEKADVYSFGVLILEIISGRQNNGINENDSSDSLITTAWNHFQEGTAEEIIDPNMMLQNYSKNSNMKSEIVRMLHVGLLCTQEVLLLRPVMPTILQMLSNKDEQLPEPTKPPFTDEGTMELNEASPSVANISHSGFYPR